MSLRILERLDIVPMLKITCNLIILLGFAIKILGLSFKISLLNRNSLKSGFYYIKFLVAPFSSLKSGFLLNRGLLNRGSTVYQISSHLVDAMLRNYNLKFIS